MENCNQLLPSGNEENQPEEQENSNNRITEQPLNPRSAHFANWRNSGAAGAISTTLQTGFSLSPQKPIITRKRKKTETTQVHGGGARVIRSPGRKDRHSKVCTARGTRDRRVRLSPKTAIDFYDVQDRLGYDRPSKAIDWLMNEAKAAIAALDEPPPPPAAETHHIRPENTFSIHSDGNFDIFTNNLLPGGFQGFLSSSSSAQGENLDATFEMAKMQRLFTWNYGNTPVPLHFPVPGPSSVSGHSQIIREPLQSSYSRITANIYSPGIDVSNKELQDFTIPEENEMDAFLHYEH